MDLHFETLIRGGTVVTPQGVSAMDIGIRDGRISKLLPPGSPAAAAREVDASGLVITPGGIDTHTHVHWPHDGTFTVDDFYTATRAAVLGGTTTIVDFVPPGTGSLRDRCQARADEAAAGSVVDFALHPILTSADSTVLKEIDTVIGDGFTSFKMYTTYEDRRIDDGAAWQLMNAIAASGGLPGFHAENHELLSSVLERQREDGRLSVRDFPESRPALAEAESIQMVSLYAKKIGTPVYIFHISGAEALGAVRRARQNGAEVYAETCTHYLTLDQSVFLQADAWKYVISPPLRGAEDREELWKAVADGTITSVGSDHCAYDVRLKKVSSSDHRAVPAGAPGIEARTPLLFSGAAERGLGLESFSEVSAGRAAKALGLYPRKGTLEPGSDADLVMWDLDKKWEADSSVPASDKTFSLYDGAVGTGRPRHVMIRGTEVVRDGHFVGVSGSGQFIQRPRMKKLP